MVIGGFLLLLASVFSKSYADGYKYTPKSLTQKQKVNQGLVKKPKMVLCRLKTQKTLKDKMACIYIANSGTNRKTYELEETRKWY